jgi:hypothetical protein
LALESDSKVLVPMIWSYKCIGIKSIIQRNDNLSSRNLVRTLGPLDNALLRNRTNRERNESCHAETGCHEKDPCVARQVTL